MPPPPSSRCSPNRCSCRLLKPHTVYPTTSMDHRAPKRRLGYTTHCTVCWFHTASTISCRQGYCKSSRLRGLSFEPCQCQRSMETLSQFGAYLYQRHVTFNLAPQGSSCGERVMCIDSHHQASQASTNTTRQPTRINSNAHKLSTAHVSQVSPEHLCRYQSTKTGMGKR